MLHEIFSFKSIHDDTLTALISRQSHVLPQAELEFYQIYGNPTANTCKLYIVYKMCTLAAQVLWTPRAATKCVCIAIHRNTQAF